MTTTFLRVLCVVVGFQVGATAQFIWKQVDTGGPSVRFLGATVYDGGRGRTVLFGGLGVGFIPSAGTWEWDGNGAWQLRTPATGPSARTRHAMAFDSLRGKTVLFGGTLSGGGYVGDTWEWDGVNWMPKASGPSAREGHAMAFDSVRGKTVMFGGSSTLYFNDTWEWDGNTWTPVSSSSGPSARTGIAMAFDSARGKTVLFGGASPNYLGDTWEWDGVNWSLSPAAGPSARSGHAMTFDSARGKTVLLGGSGSTSTADTWEWDGSTWVQAATGEPAVGVMNGLAYDSLRGRTVVSRAAFPDNTTWEWYDPDPGAGLAFGSGCGNPALTLSPDVTAQPTIGATAQALLTNVPSPFACVAVGWSNTAAGPFPLPVPLDYYGMTGCWLWQSTDVIGLSTTVTGPGTATYGLPLPFWASLIGMHLYLQAYAFAPGMNPASIILSNGLDWEIGY